MKLKMLYSGMKSEIDIIEKELETALNSSSHFLNEASLHLLKAGGKRIRPVFVLLAAKFGQYDIQQIKNVAVPLELIHMASLVHDDVIDNAELRRGRETVKAQYNNRVAMYAGDFIFAKALEYMTQIKKQQAHQVLSNTMVEICVGEIIQIEDKQVLKQNLRDYFRRIKRKTAVLISSSCELGAIASGASPEVVRHMRRFGYYVGMSFQIIDDILDYTSDAETLGKNIGDDLMEGKPTLPLISALRNTTGEQHQIIRRSIATGGTSDLDQVIAIVQSSGALDYCRQRATEETEAAIAALEALPDSEYRQALKNLALLALHRIQ